MRVSSNPPAARKRLIRATIVGLTVILAVLLLLWWRLQPRPNTNALAIRESAKQDKVTIALQRPNELNFKKKVDVLAMRREAANRYPDLLAAPYEPADSIFGQIVDGLPWWGMKGQFFLGQGQRSIEGPAEETRFLLNPYLLVAADFFGLVVGGTGTTPGWNTEKINDNTLNQSDFPFTCHPRFLVWYPREGRAEAIYSVTDCMERMSRWSTKALKLSDMTFDLIAYNARDMNLNYLFLSLAESTNVDQYQPPGSVFYISHFIHQGGSCGYSGGCNNMSPATPEISNYWLKGLPAKANIRLWKNAPGSVKQQPDMLFTIIFE